MKKLILVLFSFIIFASCTDSSNSSKQSDSNDSAQVEAAESALRKALAAMTTRQWSGGWPNGSSIDGLHVRGQGSSPMAPNWLTVQPPATPATATTFLRAAELFDDETYLYHARLAMRALLAVQTEEGGFPKESPPSEGAVTGATFDDDVTTGAFNFFMDLWLYTNDEEAKQAVTSVGEFLLLSQYADSGCWPQMYPINPNHYSRYVTFNDGVMANAIAALIRLDKHMDDSRYLEAALRGGDCIISLQGGPGEEVWGQQHDPETLLPAPARIFEPAGYTAGETGDILTTLIELYLYTGEERFLEPIPKALAWYDANQLPNGNWARIYEVGTRRPVHGDLDGNVHALLDEDGPDPRPGYVWQRDFYPYDEEEIYDRIMEIGRTAYLEEREQARETPNRIELAGDISEIIEAQHPDGWWINKVVTVGYFQGGRERREMIAAGAPEVTYEMISSSTFTRNANLLMDYIEAGE